MKNIIAAAAVVAALAAPLAAHAESGVTLDIRGLDLTSAKVLADLTDQVTSAVCGRNDMPQPLDLSGARERCRESVAREVKIAVEDHAKRAAVSPKTLASR